MSIIRSGAGVWQGQLRMLSSEQGSPNHLLSLTSGISITTSHWNSSREQPRLLPTHFSPISTGPLGFPFPGSLLSSPLDWELLGNTVGTVSFISVQCLSHSRHSVNPDDQRYELVGWGPPRGRPVLEPVPLCSSPRPTSSLRSPEVLDSLWALLPRLSRTPFPTVTCLSGPQLWSPLTSHPVRSRPHNSSKRDQCHSDHSHTGILCPLSTVLSTSGPPPERHKCKPMRHLLGSGKKHFSEGHVCGEHLSFSFVL